MDIGIFDLALGCAHPAPPLYLEIKDSALSPQAQEVMTWWRREPGASPPPDLEALDWIQEGYVLDIGCSTGRHLELLAQRGVRGHGIDTSPTAVSQAKTAGVSCVLADVNSYQPPHPVDAVLAMGGNGGMVGRREALPGFLRRIAGWLRQDGVIVFTATNWRGLLAAGLDDGSGWTTRRYPGDLRMRFHFDGQSGPWFPWLFVDPETLAEVCADVGLEIVRQKQCMGGISYAALLKPVL
jgi:SAM-dependent methyltransferase